MDRRGVGLPGGDERVPDLMVGDDLPLARGDDRVFALVARDDHLDRFLKVALIHEGAAIFDGAQRGFVDDVGKLRARGARGRALDHAPVDVRLGPHVLCVDPQDRLAAREVGQLDGDAPVEAAGAQQRRVERFGAVGGGEDDDALAPVEAVHLGEQLVEGLLALVVAAHHAAFALFANRVDLVDKDDAGGFFIGLLKEVADLGSAHAHKHFHELRTGYGEKRYMGFSGDRLGEQRLARSGRAHKQRALGQVCADLRVFAGVVEEVDDLGEGLLGLVLARHVLKGLARLGLHIDFGVGLAEGHRVASAAHPLLHRAHEELPDQRENGQRQDPGEQKAHQGRGLFRHDVGEFDPLLIEAVNQPGVVRHLSGHVEIRLLGIFLIGDRIVDVPVIEICLGDLARLHVAHEGAIINLGDPRLQQQREDEDVEQHHDQHDHDDII